MIKICVLGSTGSIGTQTLEILKEHSGTFECESLSAHSNVDLLTDQILEFQPKRVCVGHESMVEVISERVPTSLIPEFFVGEEGLSALAGGDYDVLMLAVLGFAALPALDIALASRKAIAIANKESLVAAGGLIRERITDLPFIPVDSEHNSLYQCLKARPSESPTRVAITASGGPFLGWSRDDLERVTPEMAVQHPNWNMGAKISVDSATLMNKGLELIEAAVLFGFAPDDIQAIVHPESIVHALVEFQDASTHAVLYPPSMKVPIAHALFECADKLGVGVPDRTNQVPRLFDKLPFQMRFTEPDIEAFPCLMLAERALREGPSSAIVLNAANELAVSHFLEKKISFLAIPEVIERAMDRISGPLSFSCFEEIQKFHESIQEEIEACL